MYEMQSTKHKLKINGFNCIYYFEFSKDFSHPLEKHDFWEMVYVDNGRVNAISNSAGYSLEQGQVLFHAPMEMHAHVSDRRVANSMLVVCFSSHSPVMRFFKNKTFTLDKSAKTVLSLFMQEAKNALGKIPDDYEDKNPLRFVDEAYGASQLMECYFTEFLLRLIRGGGALSETVHTTKESRDIATSSLNELILEYMKENLYSTLTLKDLCHHFLMGKTQLCKIFHDGLGKSPMDFYSELKIAESKKLLREKNHTVTQIADMLCYSSVHNFSRAFKKSVGFSPTQYAKRIL